LNGLLELLKHLTVQVLIIEFLGSIKAKTQAQLISQFNQAAQPFNAAGQAL
jgi:hypothetical protein